MGGKALPRARKCRLRSAKRDYRVRDALSSVSALAGARRHVELTAGQPIFFKHRCPPRMLTDKGGRNIGSSAHRQCLHCLFSSRKLFWGKPGRDLTMPPGLLAVSGAHIWVLVLLGFIRPISFCCCDFLVDIYISSSVVFTHSCWVIGRVCSVTSAGGPGEGTTTPEQPDLVEAVPAHCRGVGLDGLQRSLPTQTIL